MKVLAKLSTSVYRLGSFAALSSVARQLVRTITISKDQAATKHARNKKALEAVLEEHVRSLPFEWGSLSLEMVMGTSEWGVEEEH